jgi:hypothetical protein
VALSSNWRAGQPDWKFAPSILLALDIDMVTSGSESTRDVVQLVTTRIESHATMA